MGNRKLLTTDQQIFLADEFKNTFSRVFESQELFEKEMKVYLRTCDTCKSCHWIGCKKRCECDYKNDNHGHQENLPKTF